MRRASIDVTWLLEAITLGVWPKVPDRRHGRNAIAPHGYYTYRLKMDQGSLSIFATQDKATNSVAEQ